MSTMNYYNVIVPEGDNPTDAQVRLGQQSDGSAAIWSGGLYQAPNGVTFFGDATGLTNYTTYDSIVVVDGPEDTLRGQDRFRSAPSSIAATFVEQYDGDDGQPVVVGWNDKRS